MLPSMDRPWSADGAVGDATLLLESSELLLGRPLLIGTRTPSRIVWIAPSVGFAKPDAFASFEDPIVTESVATFGFFPAIGLSSILHRLQYGIEDPPISLAVAAAIVTDIAQQLAHSGLRRPTLRPDDVLVGFDGRARTIRHEHGAAQPTLPLPSIPSSMGISYVHDYESDDEGEDTIGIFSIAEIFAEDRRAGTPDAPFDGTYDAPEEVEGNPVTATTIAWKLGSLLFHLLERLPPVGSGSRLERLATLRQGLVPLTRSVPVGVGTLLEHALALDPTRRPPSASAFLYHLQPFAAEPEAVGAWLQQGWPSTHRRQQRLTSGPSATTPPLPPPTEGPLWVRAGALEVMRRPVLQSEFDEAFGLLTPKVRTGGPAVLLPQAQAQAYAGQVGGRLPTSEEWTTVMPFVVDAWGHYGQIWEWTQTPHRNGHRVRGGPWRNVEGIGPRQHIPRVGVLDHESWESQASPDVGFRLVRDRA